MTTKRETARARLEIDPKRAAPEGTLTWAEGQSVRFSGWMELASAIEGWRTEASNGTPGAASLDGRTPEAHTTRMEVRDET